METPSCNPAPALMHEVLADQERVPESVAQTLDHETSTVLRFGSRHRLLSATWLVSATCMFGSVLALTGCGGPPAAPAVSTLEASATNDSTPRKLSDDSATPMLPQTPGENASLPTTDRGEAAFAKLLAAARGDDPNSWTSAEQELQALGAAAVPALIPALEGEDALAREMAVMFLAQLGPEAKPAETALTRLLDDPSPFIRINVASVLTTFETPHPRAVPTLVELLSHEDAQLRMAAASSLGNVGAFAEPAIPALAKCLADDVADVRQAAATSLGRLGPVAAAALPKLRSLTNDENAAVKEAATLAVGILDGEGSPSQTIPASASDGKPLP